MYRESPAYLNFCILSSFFVNGPQALHVSPGYLKCSLGINLSPANNNLFYYFFQFVTCIILFNTLETKEDLLKEFYLKVPLFLSYLIIH